MSCTSLSMAATGLAAFITLRISLYQALDEELQEDNEQQRAGEEPAPPQQGSSPEAESATPETGEQASAL